jgi:hypothetical protein
VALWIQASPVCANIVFESTNPLIQYYINKIPAADLSTSTQGLFTALSFLGVSKRVVSWLKGFLDDSVALIISFVFMFTPAAIANFGVIIVALLLPAFKGSKLLASDGHISSALSTPSKQTALSPNTSAQCLTWLKYWMFLAILLTLREYNLAKLYPSAMMILTLWLQNTHFAGSDLVLRYATGFWRDIEAYEKKKQSEKKRKDEAATAAAVAAVAQTVEVRVGSPEATRSTARSGSFSGDGVSMSAEEAKAVRRKRTPKKGAPAGAGAVVKGEEGEDGDDAEILGGSGGVVEVAQQGENESKSQKKQD